MGLFACIGCLLGLNVMNQLDLRDTPYQKKLMKLRDDLNHHIITMEEYLEESMDATIIQTQIGGADCIRKRNKEIVEMYRSGTPVAQISKDKKLTEGKINKIINGR